MARVPPLIAFYVAEFLSLTGNQIAAVAIPLLVLEVTGSPLITGIAGAGNILPVVIAVFIGGPLIDQQGARRASVIADLFSGFSTLALPITLAFFSDVSPAIIFTLVFLGALFDPAGASARQTMLPGLAKLAQRPLEKVNGLRGGLENAADFSGPVLGGILVGLLGVFGALYVNSLSFFLCALILALLIPSDPDRTRAKDDTQNSQNLRAGPRFLWANPELRTLALIGFLANFFALPFLGLLLPMLTALKFQSPALLGFTLSAFGIAATIGAFAYPSLAAKFSRSLIYYGGLFGLALAIVACALVQSGASLLPVVFAGGLLLGASNPLELSLLQENTPPALSGRVYTAHTAIRFAGGPFGLLVAGFLLETVSLNYIFITTGALLALVALIGRIVAPLKAG